MKDELLPTNFSGMHNDVYARFWTRVGAKLLDFIIILPILGVLMYVNSISIQAYLYSIVPTLLFSIFYEVFLVKQFGGTPGKLIMGIKIVKNNGDDVDWRAAAMRYLVEFIIAVIGIYVMVLTLNMIDNATYISVSFWKRSQFLSTINPFAFQFQQYLNFAWVIALIITLLIDGRKRTVHDFIAGTVVVKSIYIDKIREIGNQDENSENNIE